MIFSSHDKQLTTVFLNNCRKHKIRVAVAESCTGGLVSAMLTDIAGSSDVFDRGFITYANEAKQEQLGIDAALIETHGAVSAEIAQAMAEAALQRASVQLSVAITGIAGPAGGTPDKPVGLVHFACAYEGQPTLKQKQVFAGTREQIRTQAMRYAIGLMQSRFL